MTEQRLLTCVLVSFTLHMAFLAFVPSLLSRPASSLKRPLWVDLVELRENAPQAPAVASPAASSPAEATPQDAEGRPARPAPSISRESREGTSAEGKTPGPPFPSSRPLPSARELIPTVNSLLGLQRRQENPLSVEPSVDIEPGMQRGPEYEAYLREIKEVVKTNWKVSGEGESKSGSTVLRVSIQPDGSLGSLDLLQSCGMILHDYEALDAIKQSFPFRPPPENLLDEHGRLSIRFSFHYFLSPPG